MGLPVLLIRRRYRPYGYCPGCGHRINPGVCLECGMEVPPERLIRSRRVARRWSRWRPRLLLAAATVMVAAGLWVYHYHGVLKFVPSSVLISAPVGLRARVQPELIKRYSEGRLKPAQAAIVLPRLPTPELLKLQQGSTAAPGETLWARYLAGQLTQSEGNQMLRNALSLPQNLGLPAAVQEKWGMMLNADVSLGCALALPDGWQIVVDDCRQLVDGTDAMPVPEALGPQFTPAIFRFRWPLPEVGEREITVVFRFSLRPPPGEATKLPRIGCAGAVGQKIIIFERGAETRPDWPSPQP